MIMQLMPLLFEPLQKAQQIGMAASAELPLPQMNGERAAVMSMLAVPVMSACLHCIPHAVCT